MNRKHALVAIGAALALAGTGAIAAASTSRPSSGPQRYNVALPEDASTAQREAVDAMLNDKPIPVVDDTGKPRGFVRDSALSARDDRVVAELMAKFREPKAPSDPEYDRLFEALRVLDPVEVVDAEGVPVGYWTSDFMSTEEHDASIAEARATAEALLE